MGSMSLEDRAVMSESFQKVPWRIDSQGASLCGRPRLYWLSWQQQEGTGEVLSLTNAGLFMTSIRSPAVISLGMTKGGK